jgi:hypothetical protein
LRILLSKWTKIPFTLWLPSVFSISGSNRRPPQEAGYSNLETFSPTSQMSVNDFKMDYNRCTLGAVIAHSVWWPGYGLDDRRIGVRFTAGSRDFLFSTAFRPALGPTQPPSQWVPGALSPWAKRLGREAAIHLHRDSRLRMRDVFMAGSEIKAQGQLYLHLTAVLCNHSASASSHYHLRLRNSSS